MSLLDKARELDPGQPVSQTYPLRERCELAIAYLHGEVGGGAVGKVIGIKNNIPNWVAQTIREGVRAGTVSVSLRKAKTAE